MPFKQRDLQRSPSDKRLSEVAASTNVPTHAKLMCLLTPSKEAEASNSCQRGGEVVLRLQERGELLNRSSAASLLRAVRLASG